MKIAKQQQQQQQTATKKHTKTIAENTHFKIIVALAFTYIYERSIFFN